MSLMFYAHLFPLNTTNGLAVAGCERAISTKTTTIKG